MPNLTPETRWRVHKSKHTTWWSVWALLPGTDVRMPGTQKTFRTWHGAMGYAWLRIAKANGQL